MENPISADIDVRDNKKTNKRYKAYAERLAGLAQQEAGQKKEEDVEHA